MIRNALSTTNLTLLCLFTLCSWVNSTCELECNACGYNWYEKHCKAGKETAFCNKRCGCCGGTDSQKDDCKSVCSSTTPPPPTVIAQTLFITGVTAAQVCTPSGKLLIQKAIAQVYKMDVSFVTTTKCTDKTSRRSRRLLASGVEYEYTISLPATMQLTAVLAVMETLEGTTVLTAVAQAVGKDVGAVTIKGSKAARTTHTIVADPAADISSSTGTNETDGSSEDEGNSSMLSLLFEYWYYAVGLLLLLVLMLLICCCCWRRRKMQQSKHQAASAIALEISDIPKVPALKARKPSQRASQIYATVGESMSRNRNRIRVRSSIEELEDPENLLSEHQHQRQHRSSSGVLLGSKPPAIPRSSRNRVSIDVPISIGSSGNLLSQAPPIPTSSRVSLEVPKNQVPEQLLLSKAPPIPISNKNRVPIRPSFEVASAAPPKDRKRQSRRVKKKSQNSFGSKTSLTSVSEAEAEDTCMGPGKLLYERPDDHCRVFELSWKLAGNSKAKLYSFQKRRFSKTASFY